MFSLYSVLVFVTVTSATTEWWGDLRAHMNPPKNPAFYDVTYDESECPEGLRSDAIPDYVYFGTMLATMSVDGHDECIQRCLDKPRCKSVNFFYPLAYQERGFCELLAETQFDNPRLLHPFRKAVYYEHIRCRETVEDSVDSQKNTIQSAKRPSKENMSQLMKKLSQKVIEFNRHFRVARK